jgi:hypothetical protein
LILLQYRTGNASSFKYMSIIFTGVFAIFGIFFDARDKSTNKITSWGRTFFSLTLVSILCGLIAQSLQSEEDAAASKIQQDRMSEILTNVKRTVDEISKTTQIIDNPSIQANFSVSCLDEKFKLICDKIIASEGEKRLPVGTYELDNSAWKDETKKFRLVQLQLIFYQDGDALARFKKECLTCFPRGDIDMSLDVLDNEKTPATFMYDSSKKDIFVEFRGKVNVDVSKKHLMTVPDLLGSSLVMYAFNSDELQGLVPKFVILRTDRGQTVAIGDFSKEIVDNRDIYISKKIISP